jgi:hypothetical protein
MARKRTAIVLSKLARESVDELHSMVVELTGDHKADADETAEPRPWSPRFAASGKSLPPP